MLEPGRTKRRRERRAQWTASPPAPDGLVLAVNQRRRGLGLAHKDFAPQVLGVSRSTWSKVWNGRRRPSRYLLDQIFARWPGLAKEYAAAVRARTKDRGRPADTGVAPAQRPGRRAARSRPPEGDDPPARSPPGGRGPGPAGAATNATPTTSTAYGG